MNELALYAGVGGGLLGTHLLGWRPVCAVEIEPYCREVLLRRQRDGVLPVFPIWDDVRTFDGRPWRGLVDVVTGGFPCQPFSVAGKGLGVDDPRNMWPDTIRVIREVGPRFCLLENVPGLIVHDYFGTIVGQLSEAGYRVRWDVVSAAETGAPHRRERLWILADAEPVAGKSSTRSQQEVRSQQSVRSGTLGATSMADADCCRSGQDTGGLRWWDADPADVGDSENIHAQGRNRRSRKGQSWRASRWGLESGLGGTFDGVADEMDLP